MLVCLLAFFGAMFSVKLFGVKPGNFIFPKIMAADKKEEPSKEFGVIDYEKLIVRHPDFEQLKKYDMEISSLGPGPFDSKVLEGAYKELRKKLEKFHEGMKKNLVSERNRIQKDSRSEIEAIQKKSLAEAAIKQKEFLKFQSEIKRELDKKQRDPNRPLSKWEKDFKASVDKRSKDLRDLVGQQITAKRLELEKTSREKLMAEKKRLDSEIAAYEDSILNENKNRKLNLHLKIGVAKDNDERQKLQDELNKVLAEEEAKVSVKRKELGKSLTNLEAKMDAENGKKLTKFRARLDKDVGKQISKIRQEVANRMMKEKRKPGNLDPFIPKEIREKIEAKRKAIRVEMNALRAKTSAQIAQIEGRANARFEAMRNKFTKKLSDYQEELSREFEKKKKEIIEQHISVNQERKKAWDELKEARKRKYDRIIEDINRQIEPIAREKNVKIVLGKYIVNVDGVDLDELAEKAIGKLKSK